MEMLDFLDPVAYFQENLRKKVSDGEEVLSLKIISKPKTKKTMYLFLQ